MSHLNERISDFVDDRLDVAALVSTLDHLAGCERCSAAAESERLIKERLGFMHAPDPGAELTARLLALPRVGGVVGEVAHPAGAPLRRPFSVPAWPSSPAGSRRPAGRGETGDLLSGRGRLSGRPRRTRLASAVAGSVGVVSAGLFGLGVVSPSANAAVAPAMSLDAARHVITMSGIPTLDVGPAWRMVLDVAGR